MTAKQMPAEVIAADVGGTNARFAIASRRADGQIELSAMAKMPVVQHASLELAFEAWRRGVDRPLPGRATIALATPIQGPLLRMTNNSWAIRPATLADRLGLEEVNLINDFSAVAYAVADVGLEGLKPVAGPADFWPTEGVVSLIGPGTGLGVGQLLLRDNHVHVLATEGGHMDFAPLDGIEDRLLQELRERFRRVSVERIVSGPGLAAIHGALASLEGIAVPPMTEPQLWSLAIEGKEALASTSLERWFLSLGSVCGDLVLAHGAGALVLAGGLVPRVEHLFEGSGFHARFMAKGRFEARMATIPIRRILHPEPGLLGAAASGLGPR